MTVATELHHVAHMGHDAYEQCPACRAAIMIGMGATVAAVIYGGGDADTLVKWVGTFTTMSEADAYCQTKADAYPGMSVLIVDEFGSYDDGRISPITTADPMADQTTWTTHGVSDAERAAIVAAAAMIGRSYDRDGGTFTVTHVGDCRPSAIVGAIVNGDYVASGGQRYHVGSWVADLGAERVAVTFAAPMADGSYSVDGLKLMSLADADRLIVAAHPRRGVIVGTNGAEVVR